MKVLILNGPNLNLLGLRQPEIYGRRTMDDILAECRAAHPGIEIEYFQSNHEGAIIDRIQQAGYGASDERADAIVLNAGGYTHTSVAIADAIAAVPIPVVEVHISDITAREPFRRHSYLTPVCAATLLGPDCYLHALTHLTHP